MALVMLVDIAKLAPERPCHLVPALPGYLRWVPGPYQVPAGALAQFWLLSPLLYLVLLEMMFPVTDMALCMFRCVFAFYLLTNI